MGRSTVYNNITSPEKIAAINPENKMLTDDFLDYLESVGRAETTIKNYRADLLIFFCWCLDELDNKSFVKVTKREIARFQNHAMKVWGTRAIVRLFAKSKVPRNKLYVKKPYGTTKKLSRF